MHRTNTNPILLSPWSKCVRTLVLFLLLTPIVVGFCRGGEMSTTLEKVMADWQQRRSKLPQALEVVFEGTATIPKGMRSWPDYPGERVPPFPPADHEYPVRTSLLVDFRGKRVRAERLYDVAAERKRFVHVLEQTLFDGVSFQVFYARDRMRRMGSYFDPGRDLELQTKRFAGLFFSERDFPFFIGGYLIFSMSPSQLVHPLNTTNLRFHGKAPVDGGDYTVLRTTTGGAGQYYEVYVDLDRQSAIRRLIRLAPDGVEQRRLDITDYRLKDGIWLPQAWTFTAFQGGEISHRQHCEVVRVDLSPDLDAGLFRIEPKPGMVVYDLATEESYEVPQGWRQTWLRIAVGAAALVLAVGAGVAAFRRRGRGKAI